MSREMRDVRREIESRSGEVAEHLIKLGLYPENPSKNHWRQEIYSFIHKVYRLKKTNKFPRELDLFDWMWDSVKDEIRDWGRVIITEYGKPAGMCLDEVEAYSPKYYEWLATNLSKSGAVTRDEVYRKLEELGF